MTVSVSNGDAVRMWVRRLIPVVLAASLAACTLPNAGPTKRQIYSGSVQREGDAFIVKVNDQVTRATALVPALQFTPEFLGAGQLNSDTIRSGDILGLRIWENVDDGLLARAGAGDAVIDEVQVDGSGFIFVPYAGRIKAAGKTPDQLRQEITAQLDAQTPDPQVTVARLAGNGSTVSVVGRVNNQGVYPIERSSRTLSTMIAQAGGVSVEEEISLVTVVRGGQTNTVWLTDVYNFPGVDIALRPNDRIVVEEDTRSFVSMGATGQQARVRFESQDLSAIEALAQVGGLRELQADPTGIFIFRNEPEDISRALLGRDDLIGAQRMVYVLDLTEPNGLFQARDFVIRDGDTIYVTEAPVAQWGKTVSLLIGSIVTPAAALNNLANLGN